ncbi:Uncharacterised protein [Chlamydia abortus]|nr:Uncharacterised protein [Chlamydia abortus]
MSVGRVDISLTMIIFLLTLSIKFPFSSNVKYLFFGLITTLVGLISSKFNNPVRKSASNFSSVSEIKSFFPLANLIPVKASSSIDVTFLFLYKLGNKMSLSSKPSILYFLIE